MQKKARYDDENNKMDISGSGHSQVNLEKATLHLKVPFPTAREAEIAYNSLRVDGEPKRSQVVKTLSVDANNLILDLEAPDARQIRLCVTTFMDHLILVQKTINKFSVKSSA